jgi:hypothetical protein
MEYHAHFLQDRPEGCICKPKEWKEVKVIPPICSNWEPMEEPDEQWCKHCGHKKRCHIPVIMKPVEVLREENELLQAEVTAWRAQFPNIYYDPDCGVLFTEESEPGKVGLALKRNSRATAAMRRKKQEPYEPS